jgi:hypothetical protein
MKPAGVQEFERALYEQAVATVTRAPDKSFAEADLEAALADLIEINVGKEKRKRAKEIISSRARPGATEPAGQLVLPGLDPYLYEPDRLIRDDSGNVVENRNASIEFKQADARRAREHAKDATLWAERKTVENERFAAWALREAMRGRPALELTWGTCLVESAFVEAAAA